MKFRTPKPAMTGPHRTGRAPWWRSPDVQWGLALIAAGLALYAIAFALLASGR